MGGLSVGRGRPFSQAPRGDRGQAVLLAPRVGRTGTAGQVEVQSGTNETADAQARRVFAGSVSLQYLSIVLRDAENHYANDRHDRALEQLEWLGELLIEPAVHPHSQGSALDGTPVAPTEPAVEFDAVRTRTLLLMQRLSQGLDFWGNVANYVPMVDRSVYAEAVESMLSHARNVEATAITYRDAERASRLTSDDVRGALDAQERFVIAVRDRARRIAASEMRLVNSIDTLSAGVVPALQRITSAGEAFKAEVARGAGCGFMDVVKVVATIAITIKTAGAGTATMLAAMKTYDKFDAKIDDRDGRLGNLGPAKYKLQRVSEVAGGVAAIAKGYEDIRGLVDRKPQALPDLPTMPLDAGKLAITRSELNRTVEPFRHLPSARAYVAAVDAYIDLVTTRNTQILEYNALAAARAELQADEVRMLSETTRLKRLLSVPNRSHLPVLREFMARANDHNKRQLRTVLREQHRAFEYWAASRYPFEVVDDSVTHLAATHAETWPRLLAAMNNQGRTPEKLLIDDALARFSLTRVVGPHALKELASEDGLVFTLPYQPFEVSTKGLMRMVRMTHVRLSLPGLAFGPDNPVGSDPILVELTHSGRALMVDGQGQWVEFKHDPRTTTLIHPVQSAVGRKFSLGSDQDQFIKLTPIGPWVLRIGKNSLSRLDFSGLTDIELSFEGEFFSSGG